MDTLRQRDRQTLTERDTHMHSHHTIPHHTYTHTHTYKYIYIYYLIYVTLHEKTRLKSRNDFLSYVPFSSTLAIFSFS